MHIIFYINLIIMSTKKRQVIINLSEYLVKIWLIKAVYVPPLCAQTFPYFVYYDRILLHCPPLLNRTTLRLRENEPLFASSSAYFWSWHFYQMLETRKNQPDLRQEPTHEGQSKWSFKSARGLIYTYTYTSIYRKIEK